MGETIIAEATPSDGGTSAEGTDGTPASGSDAGCASVPNSIALGGDPPSAVATCASAGRSTAPPSAMSRVRSFVSAPETVARPFASERSARSVSSITCTQPPQPARAEERASVRVRMADGRRSDKEGEGRWHDVRVFTEARSMASSPLRALKKAVRDSSPHNNPTGKPPGWGVLVTPVAQRTRAAASGR